MGGSSTEFRKPTTLSQFVSMICNMVCHFTFPRTYPPWSLTALPWKVTESPSTEAGKSLPFPSWLDRGVFAVKLQGLSWMYTHSRHIYIITFFNSPGVFFSGGALITIPPLSQPFSPHQLIPWHGGNGQTFFMAFTGVILGPWFLSGLLGPLLK